MAERIAPALVVLGLALAGCQAAPQAALTPAAPPTAAGQSRSPVADGPGVPLERPPPRRLSAGWRVTTYYTPVESFHSGKRERVRGCRRYGCARPKANLGRYPASFIEAVSIEGHGRITSGPQAGRYLSWSRRVGHFWLDDIARDGTGRRLRPWVTAAADRSVLPRGSRFVIVACGRKVTAGVCARFRAARWKVTDSFAPGYGGSRHADVYIGEETGPGFVRSPFYTTLDGATLGLG